MCVSPYLVGYTYINTHCRFPLDILQDLSNQSSFYDSFYVVVLLFWCKMNTYPTVCLMWLTAVYNDYRGHLVDEINNNKCINHCSSNIA